MTKCDDMRQNVTKCDNMRQNVFNCKLFHFGAFWYVLKHFFENYIHKWWTENFNSTCKLFVIMNMIFWLYQIFHIQKMRFFCDFFAIMNYLLMSQKSRPHKFFLSLGVRNNAVVRFCQSPKNRKFFRIFCICRDLFKLAIHAFGVNRSLK